MIQYFRVHRRKSKQQRHFSDDLLLGEPTTRRAEEGPNGLQSVALWQVVEEMRRIRIEARPQTWTKTRTWPTNLLPKRPGIGCRRFLMKFQSMLSRHELN